MKKLKNISDKQIEQYLLGKLDSLEQKQFDEFLSENPFEAEALEGLQSIGAEERERDIATLKQELPHYQTPSFRLNWAGIAASVAFLVTTVSLAFWFMQNPKIEDSMALKDDKTETPKVEGIREKEANNQPKLEEKTIDDNKAAIKTAEPERDGKKAELSTTNTIESKDEAKTETEEIAVPEKPTDKLDIKTAENNTKTVDDKELAKINKDKGETVQTSEDKKKLEVLKNAELEREEQAKAGSSPIKTQTADTKNKRKDNYYSEKQKKPAKKEKSPNQEQRALNMSKENMDRDGDVNYDLQGQVIDSRTQKAVGGVDVSIKDQNVQGKTDSLGNYLLRSSQNNNILLFNKNGYETQQLEVKPNERKIIYLKPKF